ncbi:MAG: aminodeoxychorismate/anthranilate synthase component II, partial [Planctomycetota bacterium]
MVIVIDNYDSFTYNLVQRLGEIDSSVDIRVLRNDEKSVDEISAMAPQRIIISPGPCTPNQAGVSVDCVRAFGGKVPLLGVCLGHQSIGQALGATIIHAPELMHGKTDEISHDDGGLFAGVESPFVATRYHSLVIDPETMPADLQISA